MARAAVLGRLTWQVGTLVAARRESLTARTLVLDVPGWPGHLPGQHVDLRLTAPDGYSTQRSYSIASAWDVQPATGNARVELTVEEVEDGEVSPYLVEVMRIGDPIELRGPVGGWFVWRPDAPDGAPDATGATLLAAGGSGVVPLMAMLRARRLAGSRAPFRLVYSARSPTSALYAEELAELASDGSGLEVEHVYTRSAPPGWAGPVGRVRPEQLVQPINGRTPDAAFVCGATGFVESVADVLTTHGVDPRRVKTERFGPTGG
jgi:ferredoxin-NADP reductase